MTHEPRSGCGPGEGVPLDTPRHGTRSVPRTHTEKLIEFHHVMGEIHFDWIDMADMATLGQLLQRAADLAHALAGKERRKDTAFDELMALARDMATAIDARWSRPIRGKQLDAIAKHVEGTT